MTDPVERLYDASLPEQARGFAAMFRSNAYTADDRDMVIAKFELLADALARQAAQPDPSPSDIRREIERVTANFSRDNDPPPCDCADLVAALEHLSAHCGDLAHWIQASSLNEEAFTAAYHKARYAKEIASKALAAHKAREPKP